MLEVTKAKENEKERKKEETISNDFPVQ